MPSRCPPVLLIDAFPAPVIITTIITGTNLRPQNQPQILDRDEAHEHQNHEDQAPETAGRFVGITAHFSPSISVVKDIDSTPQTRACSLVRFALRLLLRFRLNIPVSLITN